MILVDSSVWIDYLHGTDNSQTNYLDSALDAELLLVGDLILTEVLQGIADPTQFERVRRTLTALDVITIGGAEIALAAAENYRALRRRGVTVRKTIDCLIATRCIADGIWLLHNDRDFDPFVAHLGLRVAP